MYMVQCLPNVILLPQISVLFEIPNKMDPLQQIVDEYKLEEFFYNDRGANNP